VSHSNRSSLLGRLGRPGTVHIVDTHVSRSYRQKAMIAFVTITAVVGLLAAVVISHEVHPILGLILGLLCGAVCGATVGVLVAVWPLLRVLVHWSVEIALAGAVLAGWIALMHTLPATVGLLVLAVVVGVPAALGRIRRLTIAWWWCLVVRHRLRLYFAHHSSGQSLVRHGSSRPLILWARPTPAGERVWVWLRPGLSLKDLEAEGQMARLAVTCWAAEARVIRASRSYAGLLRVDITRREPLAGTVLSPLPTLLGTHITTDMPTATPTVRLTPEDDFVVGLDLPDVPDNADPPTTRSRRASGETQPAPSRVDANYDYA